MNIFTRSNLAICPRRRESTSLQPNRKQSKLNWSLSQPSPKMGEVARGQVIGRRLRIADLTLRSTLIRDSRFRKFHKDIEIRVWATDLTNCEDTIRNDWSATRTALSDLYEKRNFTTRCEFSGVGLETIIEIHHKVEAYVLGGHTWPWPHTYCLHLHYKFRAFQP